MVPNFILYAKRCQLTIGFAGRNETICLSTHQVHFVRATDAIIPWIRSGSSFKLLNTHNWRQQKTIASDGSKPTLSQVPTPREVAPALKPTTTCHSLILLWYRVVQKTQDAACSDQSPCPALCSYPLARVLFPRCDAMWPRGSPSWSEWIFRKTSRSAGGQHHHASPKACVLAAQQPGRPTWTQVRAPRRGLQRWDYWHWQPDACDRHWITKVIKSLTACLCRKKSCGYA